MTSKKKIYISGQITGLDLKQAQAKFAAAEKVLQEQGYEVYNPMKLVPYSSENTWKDYMVEDLRILFDMHVICMLPCWVNSKGAKIEHDVAKHLSLEVIHYSSNDPAIFV